MKFYVSCRPLIFRKEIISPKECLKNNFPGLKFSFVCVGFNRKIDGRWLYEITIDDSYDDAMQKEIKQVIMEALMPFAVHEKTDASAAALKEIVCGKQTKEALAKPKGK